MQDTMSSNAEQSEGCPDEDDAGANVRAQERFDRWLNRYHF